MPIKAWSGQGRLPTRLLPSDDHQPVSAEDLALSPPASDWQGFTCRSIACVGAKGDLASRLAAKRIRPAHHDCERDEPWPELWLLIKCPDDGAEPIKFWFANLPVDADLDNLVRLPKLRWRIERDYLELEQELGLGRYGGHGWRGFHHHASLCIAACGFLIAERLTSSPEGGGGKPQFRLPKQSKAFKPRGAPHQARMSRHPFHRHHAMAYRHRTRLKTFAMALLVTTDMLRGIAQFMTQSD